MPAGKTTLYIEQGTDFTTSLSLNDVNNTAVDLTNYTIAGKMRKSYYSTIGVHSFTVAIDSPATAGNITISMTAAQTAAIEPSKRYVYDVNITLNGAVTRVLQGIVVVSPNATY